MPSFDSENFLKSFKKHAEKYDEESEKKKK